MKATSTNTTAANVVMPQSKFHVTLPLPPSTNNLFATVGSRRVKSREYKAWLANAEAALIELRKPAGLPAGVRVSVFGSVNRQRDLDNMLKPVLDALVSAGVLPGDSLKYVTEVRIGYGGEWDDEPAVMVAVEGPVVLR